MGNHWSIDIICLSGIDIIMFDLTLPSLLTLYIFASFWSRRRNKETSNGNVYYYDAPKTPYDGENINDYSNNEGNNCDVAPDPPKYDEIINVNYNDEKKYYEVTPDTSTNDKNNKQSTMMKKNN